MKLKLNIGASNFVQIFENLEKVSDILGIPVDAYGINIRIKKGLFKGVEENYIISYLIAKTGNKYIVVFRLSGSLDPIARLEFEDIDKGCMVSLSCLSNKELCSYINDMLKKISKNIDKVLDKLNNIRRSEYRPKFNLSSRYTKVIDGLAEVTLSSLYLKYPLLDRRIAPLSEVIDIENFLNKMYNLYSTRVSEIFIHISASTWMFIVAVNFSSREYTPSFIDNTTNHRLVGREALEALKLVNDPYVTITILTTRS
ncbi:MAG: hypothetical protein QXV06_03985 [Ignisphaera sp.]